MLNEQLLHEITMDGNLTSRTAGRFGDVQEGRDGSPSRPHPGNGSLGEASLPQRKWLGHGVPSWVDEGVFMVTINCHKRGGSPLLAAEVIERIRAAVLLYHGSRWWVHLWLVMPDHVHAVLSFPQGESMVRVVGDWKRYVGRKARVGWQKGFFDHRLRNDASFEEKAHYIRMNPVRARLVDSPEDWPHVWVFDGRDGSPSRPHPENGRLGEASLPQREGRPHAE